MHGVLSCLLRPRLVMGGITVLGNAWVLPWLLWSLLAKGGTMVLNNAWSVTMFIVVYTGHGWCYGSRQYLGCYHGYCGLYWPGVLLCAVVIMSC